MQPKYKQWEQERSSEEKAMEENFYLLWYCLTISTVLKREQTKKSALKNTMPLNLSPNILISPVISRKMRKVFMRFLFTKVTIRYLGSSWNQ